MAIKGTRNKARYRGDNIYVSVFPPKREIFISRIENADADNDLSMAGIDVVARLSSKCWQAYGLEELIKQLTRASRVKSDLPNILKTILEDIEECLEPTAGEEKQ